MAQRFLDLSPMNMSSDADLTVPVSDLIRHFDTLFPGSEDLCSPLGISLLPFDLENSDDSGFGSLDGTASSFLSDITSSTNQGETTQSFSELSLNSSALSDECSTDFSASTSPVIQKLRFESPTPELVAKQLSFDSPDLPVSKQLSFDSPASTVVSKQLSFDSPDSPAVSKLSSQFPHSLAVRQLNFNNSFVINTNAEDNLVEEITANSPCVSPATNLKNRTRNFVHNNTTSTNQSETTALYQEDVTEDLIGDFSRPHQLPIVAGKHQDLKSITADTVAELITGINVIDAVYKIIDCRYPYEYEGGHIEGAVNYHTPDKIQSLLTDSVRENTILIFHCEFSSERGPKRARFLRSLDRQLNSDHYPRLNFPEIYILDGGYKEFYHQYPDLCTPEDYTPMLHPEYRDQLKVYRSSACSWKAGKKSLAAKIHKIKFKY